MYISNVNSYYVYRNDKLLNVDNNEIEIGQIFFYVGAYDSNQNHKFYIFLHKQHKINRMLEIHHGGIGGIKIDDNFVIKRFLKLSVES